MNFLRAFLALWLVLQGVLPLLPMWGVFFPHEHFSRGRVSARDWQAHGENHRNSRAQDKTRADDNLVSVATSSGISSLFGSPDVGALQSPALLLSVDIFSKHSAQGSFFARAVDLPIHVPPPNA